MSRCYPYPPPGYAGNCSSHEALILSIKLQKEKEKAKSIKEVEKITSDRGKEKSKSSSDKKKDKKGKKRDREDRKDKKSKEERKKEKREKKREKKIAKASAPAECRKQDFADKLTKPENVVVESNRKLQKTKAELLERSSVTEEHGQPIDSQNAPCSSDSTGNSGKRKRSMSSPSGIQSNGNIIRIRLSTSQKRDEPSTSGSKGQDFSLLPQAVEDTVLTHSQVRPCVSQARQDTSVRPKGVIAEAQRLPCPASTSTATLRLTSAELSGLKVEVSQKEDLSSHKKINTLEKLSSYKKINTLEKLSSHDRRMQKKELKCKKLFVDWMPPALETVEEDDDTDWLFGKKDEDRSAKRLRASNDFRSQVDNLPCSASAVMQPRALYMADAEMYALPFTIPF